MPSRTSTVRVTGQTEGNFAGGAHTVETERTNSDAPAQVTQVALQSGFNSIAVPAKALTIVIVRDPTSTITVTLKGVTGDTGIAIGLKALVIPLASAGSPSTIGLTASGTETLLTEIHFF